MREEIKTLVSKVWDEACLAQRQICWGQLELQSNQNKVAKAPLAVRDAWLTTDLTEFKLTIPDVEKPDFEALAKSIVGYIWTPENDPNGDKTQNYIEDFTDGAERVWNELVLPLHTLLKSKE